MITKESNKYEVVSSKGDTKLKIRTFTDLEAWKRGHALVLSIYRLTRKFPKDEQFGITNQMRRAAVSITSNIAEGFSRQSWKERSQFYAIALGSLTEIQNQLLISRDIGYISESDFRRTDEQALFTHKLINGLLKYSKTILILFLSLLLSTYYLLPSSAFAAAGVTGGVSGAGLVGYWPMNEGSGTIVGDHSTGAHNGTLTGGTAWTSGHVGTAVSFNTSNYVDIGTPASLEGLQVPVTITAWFKQSSTSGLQTIYGGYSGTSGGNLWSLVRIDSGTLKYYTSNSGGSYQAFGSFTPTVGQWHFVAVTVSGSLASPTVTIRLDGQTETGSLGALYATPNTSVDIQIGRNAGPGEGMNGVIDDVRVYNRALSTNETAALYGNTGIVGTKVSAASSGGGGLSGSLTASWNFDSSTVSGSSVADQSGNGHTLTLVNGASITTGRTNQALTLDGTNQYAWGLIGTLPTSVALSMWVKANDVSTTQSVLTEEGDGAPSSGYHFTLVGIKNSKFYAGFWDIGDIYSSTITAGTWYHVILTYDGVAHTQSLYVDGVLQGTQSGTWSPPSNIYFLAGYQQQGCSFTNASGACGDLAHYFSGQIDDLQGYNQAFTQNDVNSLSSRTTHINSSSATLTRGSTLASGLVGLWTFDGKDMTSTTALDRSSHGNTAALSGATKPAPTIGKLGQGLLFNGSTAYLTASDEASFDGGEITVAGWFKFNSIDSAYRTLFGKWQVGVLQQFLIQIDNNNKFGWWTGNGSSGGDVLESVATPVANRWYFVAATISGTSKRLYINGVLDNSGTGSAIGSSSVPLTIGSKKDSGGSYFEYFKGAMDDVRLYSRALTAAEIKQLYLIGK